MPKQKEIIINNKINDILKKHFSENVSLLKMTKVEELYSEGNISNSVYRFLKDVLKYQNQEKHGKVEINYTYKLEKQEKIKMTQELSDILTAHFQSDIKHIKASVLKKLVSDKIITKDQEKIFIKLKKAYIKGILDDVVDYSEFKESQDPGEEGVTEDVTEDDADVAEADVAEEDEAEEDEAEEDEQIEYSPDSPRITEDDEIHEYDDPDRPGKYKQRIKEGKT